MPILNVQTVQAGLVGVLPSLAYILTDDTIAEVTTAGYLNKEVQNGVSFQMPCLAIVATKASPSAAYVVNTYQVTHVGTNWSLVATSASDQIPLTTGNLLVGNNDNIAQERSPTGAVGMTDTGVFVLNPNVVALANLAAGITPSHIIKFANQVTTVGGAAAEAFTVTGAVAATDRAFVQVVNDGTANVTVLQAVVTNNTLTVTFSADPGADTVINYQLIRVVS